MPPTLGSTAKDAGCVEIAKSWPEFTGGKTTSVLQTRTLHSENPRDLACIQKIRQILQAASPTKGFVCAPLNPPLYAVDLVTGDNREVFFLQGPVLNLPDGQAASGRSSDLRQLLDSLLQDAEVEKTDLSGKYTETTATSQ